MGDPGLLREGPHISTSLSEAGGDREQSAAADPTGSGLDAMADPALNHRRTQGPYSCGGDFIYGGMGRLDS